MLTLARRMLSPGGAPAVRAVHSQRQRMVWLEAEPGLFIHAVSARLQACSGSTSSPDSPQTIELPRPTRHARTASSATVTSLSSPTIYSPALEDDSLLASLSLGYREYRLRCGTLAGMLEAQGREVLVESLRGFWEEWVPKWSIASGEGGAIERVIQGASWCVSVEGEANHPAGLPLSPLSTPDSQAQLAPLLTQFAASNSSALPILLHESSILHLPSVRSSSSASSTRASSTTNSIAPSTSSTRPPRPPPPPLSEQDLLALVHHLASKVPPPAPLALNSKPAPQPKPPTSAPPSDSRWNTYTLGMGTYLSPSLPTSLPSLSLPNSLSIPGLSNPSSHSPPTPKAPHERESSSWGLRRVSWMGLGSKGHSRSASKVGSLKEATESELPAVGGREVVGGGEEGRKGVEVGSFDVGALAEAMGELGDEAGARALGGGDGVEGLVMLEGGGEVGLATPEEVASEEDGEENGVGEEAESVLAEEEVQEKEVRRVMKAFCGEGEARDEVMEVRTFEVRSLLAPDSRFADFLSLQRGPLTLALATLPILDEEAEQWLAIKSNRLLEAVETVLEPMTPFASFVPFAFTNLAI